MPFKRLELATSKRMGLDQVLQIEDELKKGRVRDEDDRPITFWDEDGRSLRFWETD